MWKCALSWWQHLLYGRLLDSSDVSQGGGDERRVWIRHAANLPVRCGPTSRRDDVPFVAAHIVNISPAGARLRTKQAFHVGEVIGLELPPHADQTGLSLLAVVVHEAREGEGVWAVGCRFSRALSRDALAAFGVSANVPGAAEAIETSPRLADLAARYRLVEPEDPVDRVAAVVGLNGSGLTMQVGRALPIGALLELRLVGPQGSVLPQMLACVVHVKENMEGKYLVGCDFLRELTEEELGKL